MIFCIDIFITNKRSCSKVFYKSVMIFYNLNILDIIIQWLNNKYFIFPNDMSVIFSI